jgi:carbonic anhydrase
VLGVFLEGGDEHEDHAALAPVFAAASTSARFSQAFATVPLAAPLNLAEFLPKDYDSKFYTYAGSLTTPPCWQQVGRCQGAAAAGAAPCALTARPRARR